MEGRYCKKCMMPLGEADICEYCGFDQTVSSEAPPHILRPGTILHGRYLLGMPLGQGGFGITYIGRDTLLDMRVAVKEYYPNGYANRYIERSDSITATGSEQKDVIEKGKGRFLQEAKSLAQFHGTPGIVDVRDYFEENDTAYIVMEYLEGENLRTCLQNRLFSADEIFSLMDPVFNALSKIHEKGVIHRDISPDNIMMLNDGTLKLMDFGAARLTNLNDQRSVSVVLKSGYAPEEQYRPKGIQGSWTDIYALCATIYKCITGITPDDAMERVFDDQIKWPSEMNIKISKEQELVLKRGLSVRASDRFQNLKELKEALTEKLPLFGEIDVTAFLDSKNDENKEETYASIVLDEQNDSTTVLDPTIAERKKISTDKKQFSEKTVFDDQDNSPTVMDVGESKAENSEQKGELISESKKQTQDIDQSQETEESKRKKPKRKRGKLIGLLACVLLVGIFITIIANGIVDASHIVKNTSKIEFSSSMLWGTFYTDYVKYDPLTRRMEMSSPPYYTKNYQTIAIDGQEYEISRLPLVVEGAPEQDGDSQMKLTYIDQFGKTYVFEGYYTVSKKGDVEFRINSMNGNKVTKADPSTLSYYLVWKYNLKIAYEGEYTKLAHDLEFDGYLEGYDEFPKGAEFILSGKLSEGSPVFKNIDSIKMTYKENSKVCIINFTDGGKALATAKPDDDYSINVKWESVYRPYNGRMRSFSEYSNFTVSIINNEPYGFIIVNEPYKANKAEVYYYLDALE